MDFLKTWGRRLALSIQFLTRIPIKKNLDIAEGDLPAGTVFFPLAGIVVGAFGLLWALAAGLLTRSAGVMAAAAVLGGTLLTGGLHLDGLADTCDGVFSGRPRERALEIMRDSRVGAFGVMGVVFAALLKVLLLTAVLDRGGSEAVWILLLTPMAGRLGIVTAAAAGRPARTDGSGRLFLEGVYAWHFLIALAFALVMLLIGLGGAGIVCLLAALTAAAPAAWILSRRLGGLTGDCLGAVNELCELAVLTAALACLVYGLL